MKKEIWKIVKINQIHKYEVSTYGRWRISNLKHGHIVKLDFGSGSDNNYRGFGRLGSAHRVVAEAFIPNPENKPQVNHKDGNKSNNHVDNLEWVTASENGKHAWNTGLAKFTEESLQKLSEIAKNRKYSEERKRKMSESQKGKRIDETLYTFKNESLNITEICTKYYLRTKYLLQRYTVNSITNGKSYKLENWTCIACHLAYEN